MKKSSIWVWIRGLGRESGHWGSFIDDFKETYPERRLVFLDLPGAGDNLDIDPPLNLSAMVPLLRSQLRAKIGSEKFHLLGISLGAMLVMEWLHLHPDEVESAVLINPSSKRHSGFLERLRWTAYKPLFDALTAPNRRKRELAVLELVSNKPENYKEVAGQWAKIARDRPMKPASVFKQLVAAARYSPPESYPPGLPVLVLVSLGDRMVEPRCGLELAKAYGWETKTHPWGGHDLPLDDSQWVINAISGSAALEK
jgi:pimeloyl-ACP methyl ester carboxylesterase